MTAERLHDLYRSRPFRPFVIHLADGRKITVQHHEFPAIGPEGRTVLVYQSEESFDSSISRS